MHVSGKEKKGWPCKFILGLLMTAEFVGPHKPVWVYSWAEFEGPIGPVAGHDSGHLK